MRHTLHSFYKSIIRADPCINLDLPIVNQKEFIVISFGLPNKINGIRESQNLRDPEDDLL